MSSSDPPRSLSLWWCPRQSHMYVSGQNTEVVELCVRNSYHKICDTRIFIEKTNQYISSFSNETAGTATNVSGLLISLNCVGDSASFRRSASGAFSRSALQVSTRRSTNGIFRNSAGLIPTSHKRYNVSWLVPRPFEAG